ncbi:MAG: O-antigen ligase family protein [Saprospiraceae bacterium]|nr:O-antigen ligase family protein [Saprospiraceae bacterium]
MQTFLQSYKAQAVTFLFIWLVSMVLSAEFVLSVSMIALLLLALFQLKIEGPSVRLTLRDSLRENFKNYRKYQAWLAVSIPFLLVLVSWIWSNDLGYTLERLRIKLPFLVLPFAFASMPPLRKREVYTILYFLLVIMSIISAYVLVNFIANYDTVMADLGRGGHLPTPSNHIRFSLMLALAILGGGALWVDNFNLKNNEGNTAPPNPHFVIPVRNLIRNPQSAIRNPLIAVLTLFLFAFIHVLSVRSGLVSLYIALLALGAWFVLVKKRYLLGLAGIAGVVVLPIIAYFAVPSFKAKVDYARWDYLQFRQGIGSDYPDSERFASMKVGLDIGQDHLLLGVGAGDLKQEVNRRYETGLVGNYKLKMPHNQLVTIFAGTGLVGLAVFIVTFFFPLFYRKNWRNPLFLALHAVIFSSFFVENTIENNFGVSLYLFFLLVGLNFLSNSSESRATSFE